MRHLELMIAMCYFGNMSVQPHLAQMIAIVASSPMRPQIHVFYLDEVIAFLKVPGIVPSQLDLLSPTALSSNCSQSYIVEQSSSL